ncbi:MAG: NnrS family protein [Betaproteobacteria bacterium]
MALQPIAETAARAPRAARFALWDLGFRPFYLLASAFAALSILLWAAQYAGWLPFAYLRSPAWHGSEMLFGYTLAVITGFLFTAGRNWTGQPTPTGAVLAGYAALWVAGRILVVTPFDTAATWVNAAFPVAVAAGLAVPLVRSRNRRNYFFVALLVLLGATALALHLSYFGVIAWPERASLRVGLDIVLFIMAVMGGRVIPMFTNHGVPGAQARRHARVEQAALGGVLLLAAADFAQAPSAVLAVLAGALAVVHAVRLWLWQPWRTLRSPLVWILHASYGWIVLHLALRAASAAGWVPDPIAVHALTIGGIGGLTIGMMTRTAKGHTGRPLQADRRDVACYALVMAAAIARVAGAMLWPAGYVTTVVVASLAWAAAFLLYCAAYGLWLLRARADGKPG